MIADAFRRLKSSSYWRDIVWLASGNAIAQAIGVAAMPVLTRLYSPADFALQNLFLQVTGFAVVLLTWRYEYFVQLPKEDIDAARLLGLVLCVGMVGCTIATPLIWIFKDLLTNWMGVTTLKTWLVFVPVTAALISFSIAIQHFTQRRGQYRHSSLSELANKGSYVGTALAGYWILPGPAGLIMSTAASAIGKIIWLSPQWKYGLGIERQCFSFFKRQNPKKLESIRRIASTYLRLSCSMVISHLLLCCTATIPSLFIARVYGSESLGQFALVASTIYLPSGLIGNAIAQVYYQRAAERWSAGKSFCDLWRTTAKQLIFVGVPLYTILVFISPWVYPFLFGTLWVDAGRYASVMAISAFFSFATSPLDRGCLVVDAWWYVLGWHIGRALTTGLVALLAWIYCWDVFLFIIALVLQMSLMYVIDYWVNWRFASLQSANSMSFTQD
jgi:O-antigen/teichoic acid export membrane protein